MRDRQITGNGEFIVNPVDTQTTSADSTTVVQLVLIRLELQTTRARLFCTQLIKISVGTVE